MGNSRRARILSELGMYRITSPVAVVTVHGHNAHLQIAEYIAFSRICWEKSIGTSSCIVET